MDETKNDFTDFSELTEVLENYPDSATSSDDVCSFCDAARETCNKNDTLPLEAAVQKYVNK